MKWLMAMIGILGVVWLCGIFLEAPPVARVIDNDVGMSVPQPGTSVWRFTEGNSNTRFKEHGLNAALPDGRANIYLHGDSYIEGLMLSDEKKARRSSHESTRRDQSCLGNWTFRNRDSLIHCACKGV